MQDGGEAFHTTAYHAGKPRGHRLAEEYWNASLYFSHVSCIVRMHDWRIC